MSELKAEIARLARKEIKKELDPVKRVNAAQRKLIANLRRDLAELQREVNRLQRERSKDAAVPAAEGEEARFWVTGKGVVSLRKRLRLTQTEFAQLADVTPQSVIRWEQTAGKISFRQEGTAAALQEIRSMGKREAWEQLGKD
jgi:DNA-binding transcriptional regulator YiaG